MTAFRAVIIPTGAAGGGGSIDNELPGVGPDGRPDNSLPGGRPAYPSQGLPGGGGYPSTGPIVPPHGPWPGFPVHPWVPGPFPTPPIVIPPDGIAPGLPTLPIVLPDPPRPWPPLPPVDVKPVFPALPIVLPPVPDTGALALVMPLPEPAQPMPKPAGVPASGKPVLLYFGPGTQPVLAWTAPLATPK